MSYVPKPGKSERIRANFSPIPAVSGKDGLAGTDLPGQDEQARIFNPTCLRFAMTQHHSAVPE